MADEELAVVEAEAPEAPETAVKYKPSIAERVVRVCSVIALVSNLFVLAVVLLAGSVSLYMNVTELSELLEVSAEDARTHVLLSLVLVGIICVLGIAQGIIGLLSRKHHVLIKAFIPLAFILMGVEGVQVIWGLAMGDYADITTLVNALLGVLYDFFVVCAAFRVAYEYGYLELDREKRKAARAERKENKLGVLKGLVWSYCLNIAFTLIALIVTSRDNMVYTADTAVSWITITCQAVCVYLIWKRLRVARPAIIGITIFAILTKTIGLAMEGLLDVPSFIISNIFDIGMLLYMLFSKRPQELLTNELSFEVRVDEDGIATEGWPMWRNLILYYCVFSVLGHWMELAFCMLIRAGLVGGDYDPTNTMLWRDLLFPFPMEGIAVVICALWLYPFKNWLIKKINKPVIPLLISFVVNGALCTCIEFIGGITFNAQHQHWDYSTLPFNFMGQVCLQNAIGFALVCTLIVWIVYPAMERAISRVPDQIMNLIFIGALTFNLTLQLLYLIEPTQIAEAFTGLGSFVLNM